MERSRESRKAPMAAPVGVSRRRHRGNSLRDSPDDDGPVEIPETSRLRDWRKERERERERDRGRSSREKKRRGERLIHASNREDGHADSTDGSVNDEDEDDEENNGGIGGGGTLRMPPSNPASNSSPSLPNHPKSFTPTNDSTKIFSPATPWKPVDELIGVPIPRKARSASTKRGHDCSVSSSRGLIGRDQLHRQASTSPARSSLVSAKASPLRMSPPSSNLSSQKKTKVIGSNKHRNAAKASTSKTASSNQDEIEFEIAEVLYGMMTQPPDVTKAEGDLNEGLNISASDFKSRVSSPESAAAPHQSSTGLLMNSGSSVMVATVPKRKRPRPVNYVDENVGFPSRENIIPKSGLVSAVKAEPRSTVSEKNFKPVLASERLSPDLEQPRDDSREIPSAVLTLPISNTSPESENLRVEPTVFWPKDVDATLAKRDSPVNRFDENAEENRLTATLLGVKREEKLQIDLMAPPPALRFFPDRDGNKHYLSSEADKSVPNLKELKPVVVKETAADYSRNLADSDHKRFRRGSEVPKASFSKERSVNLQLTAIEKNDGENSVSIPGAGKQEMIHQHQQGQPQLARISPGDETAKDKTVPAASSLPSVMSAAGWQGGLPPLGYMTPLQGIIPMDGSTVSSTPLQPPHMRLNQPRPKRCATHCYIARSISCHQQFTRINPFWPAAAGSAAALYGANPCNLNVIPPVELHCSTGGRVMNVVTDKSLGVFPGGNIGKEEPSQAPYITDAQRKQILLPQSVPSGVPGNLLQGPAFIFPMSQQHAAAAAAAASALTTTMKTPQVAGASPSLNPNFGPGNAPKAAPATISFNYPNMATNETQYLAVLQNNPYQFPFHTHAGAPPIYRGAHPQAMPFFNGSFYSPQMLHPSQLPQQPQQPAHGHQAQLGQNMGISSGSSSQKHLQINSQKSHGNGSNAGGTANMKQSNPLPKSRPSHLPLKQQNQHLTDTGGEDSPLTADSRGSRSNFGLHTEALNLPIHAQNFALMSASSVSAGVVTASANGIGTGNHHKNGNHTDKKPLPQQGLKAIDDSYPSHQGFAVSFTSLNDSSGPPALDITSIGHNHAIIQNFPDPSRHHSYQVMVAQQAQQSKKNARIAEEVKKSSNGEASIIEDERKSITSKGVMSNAGLSIAFSRAEMADSNPGNNVIDSSSRNLKIGSGTVRSPGPLISNSMTNSQQHLPHNHQHLPQRKAQFIPHQYMASAPRGKTQSISNGNVFSDLPTNAAMGTKLTNLVSTFQQSHSPVSGGGNSPTQSQQWKQSARASVSQVASPVSAPTNSVSAKNLYQQQSHMQISFGGSNAKSLSAAQGQHATTIGHPNSAQLMVGSAAASMNHRSSGSPRTTSTAGMVGMVSSKAPQTTSLSPSPSFQVKNSPIPSRSSSPVGARNVAAAIGNSNMCIPQDNSGDKPQMFQHQQQQMKQQLSKQGMQQVQFPTSSTTTGTVLNNGYLQRLEAQQCQQQSQSPCGSSSTGMQTMCSSSIADAAAAAGNNKKAPSK